MAAPASDEREARLLSTMLNVLITAKSDPNRLSRGRSYARQGAVEDLDVHPGIVSGWVQGSRAQPYTVAIHVTPAKSFDTMTALVPDRRDVRFSCTCPDWDDPCKHAVAVMIAFAALVAEEPSALRVWRGGTAEPAPRAVIGSRTGTPVVTPHEPAATLDAAGVADLRAYLGESVAFTPEPVSRLAPPNAAWGELWAEMLASALARLTEES